jgi:DNA-binding transcriptional ArsR family regulator
VNVNVPPKSTRTDSALSGVGRYKRSPDQGQETRNAIIRALSQRPGAQVRELCVMVGRSSPSTVAHHLSILESEGKVVRDDCPLCKGKIWRVV